MVNEKDKYSMTMSLNILHHLGIGLYSNAPAVLSEVVANSWDADASVVKVTFNQDDSISIEDDGKGMSLEDINGKYLTVGYQKRLDKDEGPLTQKGRKPLGRKGIGKLSLFSIANIVEIHTTKNGVKNGLVMDARSIEQKIREEAKGEASASGVYHPIDIPQRDIIVKEKGTVIVLRGLKKDAKRTPQALRKRLARRFAIIGPAHGFRVYVDGTEITIADRDYFKKLQYMWRYGEGSEEFATYCDNTKLKLNEQRSGTVKVEGVGDFEVKGWIGSVEMPSDLMDEFGENLNKIVIMVRGKLGQEDVLSEFREGQFYRDYLIGELDAPFLDIDEKEDISTSNRQTIKEEDPRYQALLKFVDNELSHIATMWGDKRSAEGLARATKDPAVKEWYDALGDSYKKRAVGLFGKINKMALESNEQRAELIKSSILAFEIYNFKHNLDALEDLTENDLTALGKLFSDTDDIEAAIYYQLVRQRVDIIDALRKKVSAEAKEKVIQQYIGKYLWLLDPSWERATQTPHLEQKVNLKFDQLKKSAGSVEKKGRIDIFYQKASGANVIIELKKPGVPVNSHSLIQQVERYKTALRRILIDAGREDEPIEVVCIIGSTPVNWVDAESKENGKTTAATNHVRILLYDQLLDEAYKSYSNYLAARADSKRITEILDKVDASFFG